MFWLLACTANAGLIASVGLTWTVRRLAHAHGWTAGPASCRHVHELPIPRLGGVAIFLSLLFAIAVSSSSLGGRSTLLVAIPAAWMFAVGLVDDLSGVRPARKLIAQFVGATLLFVVGFRVPLPFAGGVLGLTMSFAATVAWSVLVMNAMNLVDGLDGLASGATICAAGSMLFAALHFHQSETALLSVALVGTALGFLRFNAHPATIFLGDSGSLVIGTMIAAISIRLMQAAPWGFVVSVLALAHPLAEVCLSTVRRAITAKPVFRADRRHLHHRLLDRPLSHRRSTVALVSISVVFGFFSVMAAWSGLLALSALILATVCSVYCIRAFRYREFEYLANLKRKIMNHRFAIEAHVQLHELCENLEQTHSVNELRNLIVPTFSGLGFSRAALQIPDLDNDFEDVIASRDMELSFPLISRHGKVGTLRLGWDLSAPPPIDLDVFQAEFMPVLARTVGAHLLRYREMNTGSRIRKTGPTLVPAMLSDRAGKSLEWKPLN